MIGDVEELRASQLVPCDLGPRMLTHYAAV